MDTVERLVAADNPEFQPLRVMPDRETDNQQLRELDRLRAQSKGTNA
jgi:phage shock protein B